MSIQDEQASTKNTTAACDVQFTIPTSSESRYIRGIGVPNYTLHMSFEGGTDDLHVCLTCTFKGLPKDLTTQATE